MVPKVVIVCGGDIAVPSGGTNRVLAFAKALQNDFNVHLIFPTLEKDFPRELENIKIHTVPVKSETRKSKILRALYVSYKAKKIRGDNEILQVEHSTLGGIMTFLRISNFLLDIHDLSFDDPQYTNLSFSSLIKKFIFHIEERAVKKAIKIIVVSNRMKNFIMSNWGISDEKIEVIPNGYDEKKFKSLSFKNIHEIDGMISFLGTFTHKLDLNKIIKLAKSLNFATIYMIGDGPLHKEFVRKIRENGINNVILTGRLPDKKAYELIMKSQVCIFPVMLSWHTIVSCPVKLFEYAALGKAIVADNVAEICKLFKEKNAILASNPSNHEQFIKNVQAVLEDKTLRKKLGENAKNLVKNFTWEQQGKKLVEVYRTL
jgi:glycosyltransferase involved in cell wall biosynthesis